MNYDRDDASSASTFTCDVTVTDGILTSTAMLQVFIYEINDNTPAFTQNFYSYNLSPYTDVGTIVGTVSATDGDLGYHGKNKNEKNELFSVQMYTRIHLSLFSVF